MATPRPGAACALHDGTFTSKEAPMHHKHFSIDHMAQGQKAKRFTEELV